jgi:hypothetical protein
MIGFGQSLNGESYVEALLGGQVKGLGEPFVGDGPTHDPGGKAQVAALLAIHLCEGAIWVESERDCRYLIA